MRNKQANTAHVIEGGDEKCWHSGLPADLVGWCLFACCCQKFPQHFPSWAKMRYFASVYVFVSDRPPESTRKICILVLVNNSAKRVSKNEYCNRRSIGSNRG